MLNNLASFKILASLKWAYITVSTIVGLSLVQLDHSLPNSWQATMNSALLVGAVSLLGFSLWTNRKIEKRQDLLEAALFGGATNGAKKLLETIQGMEKWEARMEVTVWGEQGQGGLIQETASLRKARQEDSKTLSVLVNRVEHLEERIEKEEQTE